MISVCLPALPVQFHGTPYFRSLVSSGVGVGEDDENVLVPVSCVFVNPEVETTDDLVCQLKTMLFWGFVDTPDTVFRFCLNNSSWSIEQLKLDVPDIEKTHVYQELVVYDYLSNVIVDCKQRTLFVDALVSAMKGERTNKVLFLIGEGSVELLQLLSNAFQTEHLLFPVGYLKTIPFEYPSDMNDMNDTIKLGLFRTGGDVHISESILKNVSGGDDVFMCKRMYQQPRFTYYPNLPIVECFMDIPISKNNLVLNHRIIRIECTDIKNHESHKSTVSPFRAFIMAKL